MRSFTGWVKVDVEWSIWSDRKKIGSKLPLSLLKRIFDSSKLKEFANDNFEIDENGRKFSKCLENAVRRGEIAHDEQYLLFPLCFHKSFFCRHVKTRVCLGKG